ncbi:hypothetical protein BC938DRAFT_473653 [Jimgerdemannia flammicorona]|uniref:Uncharacterized protein n=1 Tax=Jimgerdemannia flammicorona TaxID=994334 RepID=A0A433QT91_9FUNG|nr:hypothetical protein BC938DRAFT_473653 [Jimgerdemannia flammicorona]
MTTAQCIVALAIAFEELEQLDKLLRGLGQRLSGGSVHGRDGGLKKKERRLQLDHNQFTMRRWLYEL